MVFHIKIAANKKEVGREKEIHLLVWQGRPSLELNFTYILNYQKKNYIYKIKTHVFFGYKIGPINNRKTSSHIRRACDKTSFMIIILYHHLKTQIEFYI